MSTTTTSQPPPPSVTEGQHVPTSSSTTSETPAATTTTGVTLVKPQLTTHHPVHKRVSERLFSMQNATPTNSQLSSVADLRNASAEALADAHRRRSSSRSIKRKKFDDELVDSMSTSYPKQQKPTLRSDLELLRPGTSAEFAVAAEIEAPIVQPEVVVPKEPAPVIITSVKKVNKAPVPTPGPSSSSTSHKKKPKTNHKQVLALPVSENINYWKPSDDLALIINVQQTNDLTKVHQGVKFSCKFSYSDIEARWHGLLYDYNAKSLALAAIRQLHTDVVSLIESKALFSDAEEDLLKKIDSRNEPSFETLQNLINANAEIFLPSRTPKILLKHWLLLRHYHQLSDQSLQPLPRHESVVSFSEIEKIVQKELEEELKSPSTSSTTTTASSEIINQEIMNGIRKNMFEIRMLENEIPKFQSLLDSITGIAPSDFDNQTYAVLRGRLVRYLMRSKEITIGRTTKDLVVDVDLSLEGPSYKISRLQAIVSLQPTGEFIIFNSGKRPIYVDATPILTDTSLRINNNSLIEISTLKFIFLINQDLITTMRNEALQAVK